eukprot:583834-Prymnesium_polylepis.2
MIRHVSFLNTTTIKTSADTCAETTRPAYGSLHAHTHATRARRGAMLPRCQQLLNSWCDRNCPHSASAGALTALQGA